MQGIGSTTFSLR